MASPISRPLQGIRVVDLTQGLAGPFSAMLLAHHGADVIKVEPPEGDWSRTLGVSRGDMTAAYLACNRGKRSVVLDLKQGPDREAVLALSREADVFMESNRPGVAARLGLDFDTLHALNPDLIYVSVTGFGQQGPYSKRPVTDAIMQAFSGFMTRNPGADGLPKRVEFAVPDYTTGLMTYQAVSTALLGRALGHHGGRHVDVSLMSAMLAYQQANIIDWELGNRAVGNPLPPTGTYRTADGLMNISIVREKYFQNLCTALALPQVQGDPRFTSVDARRAHQGDLAAILEPAMARFTTQELEARFQSCEVPHCRVNRYDEVVRDRHVTETDAMAWAEQADIPSHPVFAVPGSAHSPAAWAEADAPTLGQHTAAVLAELGVEP